MLAGSRAFAELSHRFSQVKAVSASLSANPDELEASVARLQCEIGRLKAEKAAARRDYYTLRAEQCVLEAGNALIFEQDGSFGGIAHACQSAYGENAGDLRRMCSGSGKCRRLPLCDRFALRGSAPGRRISAGNARRGLRRPTGNDSGHR